MIHQQSIYMSRFIKLGFLGLGVAAGLGYFFLRAPISQFLPQSQAMLSKSDAGAEVRKGSAAIGVDSAAPGRANGITDTPLKASLGATKASNLQSALQALSPADREYVISVNKKLLGLLDYEVTEEREWMDKRYFPTIEQILSLRGKRAPSMLNIREIKQLTPEQLALHIVHYSMGLLEKDSLSVDDSDQAYMYLYALAGRELLSQHDTSLVPYMIAATIAPQSLSAKSKYIETSIVAGMYGDSTLSQKLVNQFGKDDPAAKPLWEVVRHTRKIETLQFSCAVDRYQGRPSKLGLELKEAMLTKDCHKTK
jgi:hypothetical protein